MIWPTLMCLKIHSKMLILFGMFGSPDQKFSCLHFNMSRNLLVLSVILSHSGFELDIFFSLMKKNWSFVLFLADCFEILRGGKFLSSQKKYELWLDFEKNRTPNSFITEPNRTCLNSTKTPIKRHQSNNWKHFDIKILWT